MVSVIIVVFNAEKYLKSAIESVFRQTYKEYEVIAVDDGSTDSTLQILNEYEHYHNFTLIKREHTKNLGGNRNFAIKFAKGDSIAFIDGDDIWEDDKLEIQVPFLHNYDMICSNSVLINEKDEVLYSKYISEFEDDVDLKLQDLLKNNLITVSSVLMKKSAIESSGMFEDGPDTRAEDYILWLNFLNNRMNRIRYINTPTLKYRIHNNNWSNSNLTDWIRLLNRTIKIRSSYLNDTDQSVRVAAEIGCLSSYLMLAKVEFKNHNYKESQKYFKHVITMYDKKVSVKFFKYFLGYLYSSFRSII